LLANIKISTELAKRKAERSKRLGITADRVLNELAAIAFANPDDFINLKNGMVKAKAGRADLGAIQTVKVKTTEYGDSIAVEREYKLYRKLDALEKLSKHLDLFGSTEKGERVTVIIDNIPDRRPPSSDDPAD
jgi:phage terminase small subunit